jgi:hypothetical protein
VSTFLEPLMTDIGKILYDHMAGRLNNHDR